MRTQEELEAIEKELEIKVWYDRHKALEARIENHEHYLVEKGDGRIGTPREIWEGALESAKKVEQEFGKENLGPYSDHEWGVLNGKLSAVRWMLGYDWDMLDT